MSLKIYEALTAALESWTDPQYADSRSIGEVRADLEQIAKEELEAALAFLTVWPR